MIVRLLWPARPWRQASGEERRCDAFWVECRLDEVDAKVIACVPASRREALAHEVAELVAFAQARVASLDRARAAEELEEGELLPQEAQWRRHGEGPSPWVCFLVARDASRIEAHPWHFPSGNLWNGDSPFQQIAERSIDGLHELNG